MRFGATDLDESEGAILAHSVRLPDGVLKKGRILNSDDVARLKSAGHSEIICARLDEDDVPENEAAAQLASAVAGDRVKAQAPFTGRCNVYAEAAGILRFDSGSLSQINAVDESLTLASLSDFTRVEKGQMLATVKVIPFAAPRHVVDAASNIAGEFGSLFRITPFKVQRVGLVMSRLPDTKESILDKTAVVTTDRIEHLGSTIAQEIRCDHTEAAIGAAITELLGNGCTPILVFGASAIVDRRDVVPAAIENAGGTIDHFGMPVDPGNLVLLAHHGDVPVIGVPGCARSPKLNGFDWILERTLAGEPVTPVDVMGLGDGGLLKEIISRPQQRASDKEMVSAEVPKIAAVVLAAGQSRRMGKSNKLLAIIDGKPMVRRSVEAIIASAASPIIVVLGHQGEAVKAALDDLELTFVENPNYGDGLSTSLVRGISALDRSSDGAVVMLGDMPAVKGEQIDQLIAAFDPVEGRGICVPTSKGKRGNPVLWGQRYFEEMKNMAGDAGAKHLIGEHEDDVCEVAVDDGSVLLDIDTPEALTAFGGKEAQA
jgi:molybdenum cofactor cytidylyltransferase